MAGALIETAGNQRYIFGTNKLIENLGASQLTYLAGTEWIHDAAEGRPELEVVFTISGKALILAADRAPLEDLIWDVTARAVVDAPGLQVLGAIDDDMTGDEAGFSRGFRRLHRLIEERRTELSPQAARFRRLPIVDECVTSGLPAATEDRDDLCSHESLAKRRAADAGRPRIDSFTGTRVATTIDELVGNESWAAVIHLDGNGVGSLMQEFGTDPTSLGLLAAEVEDITAAGARAACHGERVLPIVIGGDDATLICPGSAALRVAASYLRGFESAVEGSGYVDGLTACAGVAIVKPHYPFWAAYDLAEALCQEAKRASRERGGVSALDFHVLFDSVAPDLARIRGARQVSRPFHAAHQAVRLHGGPWTTADSDAALDDLLTKAELTKRVVDGRRAIPAAQLQQLRTQLATSPDQAELLFRRLCERHPIATGLATTQSGLSRPRLIGDDGRTDLLDVLALADVTFPVSV